MCIHQSTSCSYIVFSDWIHAHFFLHRAENNEGYDLQDLSPDGDNFGSKWWSGLTTGEGKLWGDFKHRFVSDKLWPQPKRSEGHDE